MSSASARRSGALEVARRVQECDPSQLVEAGDGHLYGVTEHDPTDHSRAAATGWRAHALETVHDATAADGLAAARESLAVGLDGFLYGTALLEGVHRRRNRIPGRPVDGLATRASSRCIQLLPAERAHLEAVGPGARARTAISTGRRAAAAPRCAAPSTGIDGTTGALTILGPMPGDVRPGPSRRELRLVPGPDGLLYGTPRRRPTATRPRRFASIRRPASRRRARARALRRRPVRPLGRPARCMRAWSGTRRRAHSRFDIDANVIAGCLASTRRERGLSGPRDSCSARTGSSTCSASCRWNPRERPSRISTLVARSTSPAARS